MEALLEALMPIIIQIIVAVLGLILAWIGYQKQRLQAMQITTDKRESVKTSLVTGAQAALFEGKVGNEALQAVIEYALSVKPNEIRASGMTLDVLKDNAKAKIAEVAIKTTAAENSNSVVAKSTVASKLAQ